MYTTETCKRDKTFSRECLFRLTTDLLPPTVCCRRRSTLNFLTLAVYNKKIIRPRWQIRCSASLNFKIRHMNELDAVTDAGDDDTATDSRHFDYVKCAIHLYLFTYLFIMESYRW